MFGHFTWRQVFSLLLKLKSAEKKFSRDFEPKENKQKQKLRRSREVLKLLHQLQLHRFHRFPICTEEAIFGLN